MSTLHREWQLDLNIPNEIFIQNFYSIIHKGMPYFYFSSWSFMNDIEKDFYGIIRDKTFTVWKRKGILEFPSGELWGEILETPNGITLRMQISTKNIFYKGFIIFKII